MSAEFKQMVYHLQEAKHRRREQTLERLKSVRHLQAQAAEQLAEVAALRASLAVRQAEYLAAFKSEMASQNRARVRSATARQKAFQAAQEILRQDLAAKSEMLRQTLGTFKKIRAGANAERLADYRTVMNRIQSQTKDLREGVQTALKNYAGTRDGSLLRALAKDVSLITTATRTMLAERRKSRIENAEAWHRLSTGNAIALSAGETAAMQTAAMNKRIVNLPAINTTAKPASKTKSAKEQKAATGFNAVSASERIASEITFEPSRASETETHFSISIPFAKTAAKVSAEKEGRAGETNIRPSQD
ncbi:MAG: hypothetical protein IAF08_13120 [Rhizobacter sp.]|nr:hypothetical protein [Chlorobiales bacterium]